MTEVSHDIKTLTHKAAKYCAWRERCSAEAREKLQQLGATPGQISTVLQWLVNENYINDTRFAESYVRGKFAGNQWGRMRLVMELKRKKIDSQTIEQALEQIKEDDYRQTMQKLAKKKWKEIKSDDLYYKKQKTAAFLCSKGFETDLAWQTADALNAK